MWLPTNFSLTVAADDTLCSLVSLLQATKDVLAMASLEVDLSKIEMGNTITVKWRGKPVFIRRRSAEDIELANQVDLKSLRDPQEDKDRVQNPEVCFPCRTDVLMLSLHSRGRADLK